jgi:hypothetical protein
MTLLSFLFLRLAFFSLPLHANPASLGATILVIVVSLLSYFISINITLTAIFITLVYIRGILILFSYFFSLIQNTKIFFTPLILRVLSSLIFLLTIYITYYWELKRKTFFHLNYSNFSSFLWTLRDRKLVVRFILILLLRILFIEKVIGLKQKPLRLK